MPLSLLYVLTLSERFAANLSSNGKDPTARNKSALSAMRRFAAVGSNVSGSEPLSKRVITLKSSFTKKSMTYCCGSMLTTTIGFSDCLPEEELLQAAGKRKRDKDRSQSLFIGKKFFCHSSGSLTTVAHCKNNCSSTPHDISTGEKSWNGRLQ